MDMFDHDYYLEKSHHPENFEPNCPECGGLTRHGECISEGCDLTREEIDDYDSSDI